MSEASPSEVSTSEANIASRREVLATLAVCGCCVAVGSSVASAAAPDDRVPPAKPGRSEVGTLGDFGKDGIYDAHARTKQIMLVRAGGKLYATTSICSHKRCVLKKKDEQTTKCPCHQSEFDVAGIPMGGPAKVSLMRYAIAVENGRVFVDTSKSFAEKDWTSEGASVSVA